MTQAAALNSFSELQRSMPKLHSTAPKELFICYTKKGWIDGRKSLV